MEEEQNSPFGYVQQGVSGVATGAQYGLARFYNDMAQMGENIQPIFAHPQAQATYQHHGMVMQEMNATTAFGAMAGWVDEPKHMTEMEWSQAGAETFGYNVAATSIYGGFHGATGFGLAGLGMMLPFTRIGRSAFREVSRNWVGAGGQMAQRGAKGWVFTTARSGSIAAKAGALTSRMGLGNTLGISLAAGTTGVAATVGSLMMATAPMMVADAYLTKAVETAKDRAEIQDYLQASSFRYAAPSEWTMRDQFGGGYGRRTAGQIAESIQSYEAQNPMYDMGELKEILMKGTQIGLFQGTRDADEFQKKFKDLADTLKIVTKVMHVSLSEGLDTLKALRDIGVTDPLMQKAAIGRADILGLASGKTASEMFTIGLQGAQIFKGTGVSMEAGSVANQQMYMQLANLQRQGLLTPEQIAQAGGMEAFAQGLTTKTLQFAQTGYGRGLMMSLAPTGVLDQEKLGAFARGELGLQEAFSGATRAISEDPMNFIRFQLNQEKILGDLTKSYGGMGATILPLTGAIMQSQETLRGMRKPLTAENQEMMTRFFLKTQYGFSNEQLDATMKMITEPSTIQKDMMVSLQQTTAKMSYGAMVEKYGIGTSIARDFRGFMHEYPGALGRSIGQHIDEFSGIITKQYNRYLGVLPVGELKLTGPSLPGLVPGIIPGTPGTPSEGTPGADIPTVSQLIDLIENANAPTVQANVPGTETTPAGATPETSPTVPTSQEAYRNQVNELVKSRFNITERSKDVKMQRERTTGVLGTAVMGGLVAAGITGLAILAAPAVFAGGLVAAGATIAGAGAAGFSVGGLGAALDNMLGRETYGDVLLKEAKSLAKPGDIYSDSAKAMREGADQIQDGVFMSKELSERIKQKHRDQGFLITEDDLSRTDITKQFIASPERVRALAGYAGRQMNEEQRMGVVLAEFDDKFLSTELQTEYKDSLARINQERLPEKDRTQAVAELQNSIRSKVKGTRDLSKEGQLMWAETFLERGESKQISRSIELYNLAQGSKQRQLGLVQEEIKEAKANMPELIKETLLAGASAIDPTVGTRAFSADMRAPGIAVGAVGDFSAQTIAGEAITKIGEELSQDADIQAMTRDLAHPTKKVSDTTKAAYLAEFKRRFNDVKKRLNVETGDEQQTESFITSMFNNLSSGTQQDRVNLGANLETQELGQYIENYLSKDMVYTEYNKVIGTSILKSDLSSKAQKDDMLVTGKSLYIQAAKIAYTGTLSSDVKAGEKVSDKEAYQTQLKTFKDLAAKDKKLAEKLAPTIRGFEVIEQLATGQAITSETDIQTIAQATGKSAAQVKELIDKGPEGHKELIGATIEGIPAQTKDVSEGVLETGARSSYGGLPEVAEALKVIRAQTLEVASALALIKGIKLNISGNISTGGTPGVSSSFGGP